MSNIKAAQQAKATQALSKNIRRSNGQIVPISVYLEALKTEGYRPAIGDKPRMQFNRTKYNRMTDTREQDEYSRKCDERVIEYRAMAPAPQTSWKELTKTEYDYFNSLFQEEELKTGEQWASEEELKHLFKLDTIK